MSGKRTRALKAQFKAKFGTPSRELFWVDQYGNPCHPMEDRKAVAVAGNVFRGFKKRAMRRVATPSPFSGARSMAKRFGVAA